MRRDLLTISALACGILGCSSGGGSGSARNPAGPTASPSPAAETPIGATLTLVAGDTGAPVAGATVTIAGRVYASNAAGQVTVAESVPRNALIDVVAPAILDRQTLWRVPGPLRLTLWPRTGAGGLDENFTAVLVYTDAAADNPPVGQAPLERIRASDNRVFVFLQAEVAGNPAAVAEHEAAAGRLTAASAGAIVYTVTTERPASGVVVTVSVNPEDPVCEDRVRGYFSARALGSEYISGRVVYCAAAVAASTTVTHELGHSFGLNHSPEPREIMHGFLGRQRSADFSEREVTIMRLMLQRRGGNRFPDNDRDVTAAGARDVRVVCR